MKRWLPVLVVAMVMVAAVFVGSSRDDGPATVAQRSSRIAREVRCPTCENLSAADSEAPASIAIREEIRAQLEAGRTDGEVRAYLVDRYGKDILLKPDAEGLISLVWALPVAGLVAAAAGLVVVFRRWRRQSRATATDEDRALVAAAVRGQDEELDFLLTSLDDLERERAEGEIDDADYVALRDDYTARAAALVRGGAETEPVAASGGRSWRPVLVGLVVLAAAGGAGFAVARTAGERVPGQVLTGGGGVAETSGEKLNRAAAMVREGKALDALKLYDEIIRAEPENVQALANRGWVVRIVGKQANDAVLIDKGLEYIDRALAVDPKYPDALFFKGEILFRDKNDPAAAIPLFETFISVVGGPQEAPVVQQELEAAKQAAAAKELPRP